MYGIAAVNAHNGWSIALIGAGIVFLGLVFLSVAISQLHRVLAMLEERDRHYVRLKQRLRPSGGARPVRGAVVYDERLKELVSHYGLLTRWMGEPFSLPPLLDLAEKRGLSHPELSVNALIQSGAVVPDGNGCYRWNRKVVKKIMKRR